jgi:hypothetical protein
LLLAAIQAQITPKASLWDKSAPAWAACFGSESNVGGVKSERTKREAPIAFGISPKGGKWEVGKQELIFFRMKQIFEFADFAGGFFEVFEFGTGAGAVNVFQSVEFEKAVVNFFFLHWSGFYLKNPAA